MRSGFKVGVWARLSIETMDEAEWFVLTKSLPFSHPLCGDRKVPSGFKTDLASIPRFFRRLFTVNDRHREEAVVHDYLYSIKGKFKHFELTREECDNIFLDLMKADKIGYLKRQSIYTAVRLFGGIHIKMTTGESWD